MAKIIITAKQMMMILDSYGPKFPITVKLKGLSKIEREELFEKIKKADNR